MKFSFVAAIIFTIVALMHLARLVWGWQVQIGEFSVPSWCSVVGLVVALALAVWGFRDSR